ncbi:MAG: Cysteine desulfurase IscS [Chlamydiia bacterium]|nr:Cysteine desulfurase IscS [Chlamydiia bacterium]
METPLYFDETHSLNTLPEILDLKRSSIPLSSPFISKSTYTAYEKSLENSKEMLGASKEDRLLLTKSGEEAISQVFMSHFQTEMMHTGNQHIVVFSLDHAPILKAAENLKEFGASVTFAKPNAFGQLTKDLLMKAVTKRTSFVSVSWVHPLISSIQPIYEIAAICEELNVALHLDISYAVGKLLFRFDEIPATYVTLDAKSIGGFAGQGMILTKKHTELISLVHGINQTEAQTFEDYKALEIAIKASEDNLEYINLEVARLRDYFEKALQKKFSEIKPLFTDIERLPHVSVMSFPRARSEYLLYLLKEKKLFASIGGGNFQKLDGILESLFYEDRESLSAISFSLPIDATQVVIDRAINIISNAYEVAKRVSKDLFKEEM